MSDNISWAKDMNKYSPDLPQKKHPKEKSVTNDNIKCKSNEELVKLLESVRKEFDLAYKANPNKELGDCLIYLESIKLN